MFKGQFENEMGISSNYPNFKGCDVDLRVKKQRRCSFRNAKTHRARSHWSCKIYEVAGKTELVTLQSCSALLVETVL